MLIANPIRDACKEEGLEIKIAFFLHIPFPSWDIMRLFPWEDELLQGMLGCDSIGFHINDYCWNFIDCCKRRLGSRIDREVKLVEHNNRTIEIVTLPISIPYNRFVKLSEDAESILDVSDNKQLLLGVDRLDYTKGLVHRIRAFELLLEKYPEHKENVTFFQVAVPSRTDVVEYQELKEELDQMIGSVNGKFSTPNWSPIKYIYGCIPQEQLAAFYRDSSVAVVTPLRDGMNLVAKEFVACQTKEPGVLVLSPFAGSAEFMKEALLINPYETNAFADVLHRALTLSEDERELRMIKLRNREKKYDVNYWLRSFLESVDCLETEHRKTSHAVIGEQDFSQFLSNVKESSNLAILLDYDGTLAPIRPHPDLAVLPSETKKVLERLARIPDVHLAIISGRSLENVKKMVGIEGITYAGNHGLEIIHPDGTKFTPAIPHDYSVRLDQLREKLKDSCRNGAWVEDKGSVITYHYIQVPKEERGAVLSGARTAFEHSGIKINHSHNAFEGRPPIQWDKGRAAIHILRTLFGVDWSDRVSTIFAGDDNTDEDAIRALQGMAVTFRVTQSQNIRTAANHRLPNLDSVLYMLKWIARKLEKREMESLNSSRNAFNEGLNGKNYANEHATSSTITVASSK